MSAYYRFIITKEHMNTAQPINKTAKACTMKSQSDTSFVKSAIVIGAFALGILAASELVGWAGQMIWHITPQIP